MKIDTDELYASGLAHLDAAKHSFESLSLGDVGIGLLTVGCVLAAVQLFKDWKKRKGYRMAVRERDAKETELLTQIIGDGIFEAEFAGKLSQQRANVLYNELSKKLGLHDLVPKQRRLKIVKEEIKARLFHEDKPEKTSPTDKGKSSKWNKFHKTSFAETIGKFWNTSKA